MTEAILIALCLVVAVFGAGAVVGMWATERYYVEWYEERWGARVDAAGPVCGMRPSLPRES